MLTVEDVAAIPLFSTPSEAELERLARTSADLHLSPGEFAVPEGGERALFAVLTGKIEVVKTIDGIERTLGWRIPGTIFGEVPIALGTPFPGGYRAAEPSRVMRVDIQQYYAIAAVSKEISLKVSALARERIGGLQSIADEPPQAARDIGRSPLGYRMRQPAPVSGAQPDFLQLADARCAGTGDALARTVPAGWRWSRASARGRTGDRAAAGARSRKSPRPADQPALARIRCRDYRRRAGRPRGGGLRRIRRAAHDRCRARGARRTGRARPRASRTISDFPAGSPATNLPAAPSSRQGGSGLKSWSRAPSAGIDPTTREVFLDGDDVVRARTLILATGVTWRRLAIDGLDRLIGKGVYYGAARSEASTTHGQDIHLVGAGNSAGQAALHFRQSRPQGDPRCPRRVIWKTACRTI